MESLPSELLEKILKYLTFPDHWRVLSVSKKWNIIVRGLLPPRMVSITGQSKGNGGISNSFVETYKLYSSYKENPVYINCTHNIRTGKRQRQDLKQESWMYLFKMEKVWYEHNKKRLVARHARLRWYIGENVGVLSLKDGFLKSKKDSINPPENGSSWSLFLNRHDGWRTKIVIIDFIDDGESKEAEDDPYDVAVKLPKLSQKREIDTIKKISPIFHPLPLILEHKTRVLVPYSGGGNAAMTLYKDEWVQVLGEDENGKTEVRKVNGEEGTVPSSCI